MNSKLITNTVALLSNKTSTTIHTATSSYFNPIFTVTSLNNFSFFSILFPSLSTSVFHTSTDFSLFAFSSLKTVFLSFLISLSLPSPMLITLSFNTSNLFKDLYVSPSFLLPIFHIFTITGDMSKTSTNKTFPFHHHSLHIYFSPSFLCLLPSPLLLRFSFFSYSHLLYFSLFIVYPLSFFFIFSSLSFSLLFLFPPFLAASFSNLLLLTTSIFVFVDLTTSCYSPLSVSTI